MKKVNFSNLFILIAVLMIISCKSTDEGNESESFENVNVDEPSAAYSKEGAKLLYTIPTPLEFANTIKKTGLSYDASLLNNPDNAVNYINNFKKSVNLGAYGCDLGYSFIYFQTKDAVKYLAVAKKLASELGILGAFEQSTIKRVESNINNQDSVLKVISESFSKADFYLKQNERNSTSALILAGGWIEALYIATQLVKTNPNEDVVTRIGEQKISIDILLSMLNLYKNESQEIANLTDKIKDLKIVLDGVTISYTYLPKVVDTLKRTMEVGTTSEITITDEQLKNITEKISSLRNQIIS